MLHLLAAIVAMSLVACAGARTESSMQAAPAVEPIVEGSRVDARITAGRHGGYEVSLSCREADAFGVVGLGANRAPNYDDHAEREAWRAALMDALSGLTSVHTTAFGLACNGVGTMVVLSDWREVDAAVRAVGGLLHERGVGAEVRVQVAPAPPPAQEIASENPG